MNAKLTLFNGRAEGRSPDGHLYDVPDISSPMTIVGTVKKKPTVVVRERPGQVRLRRCTFDVPDIPTLPDAPHASVITSKTKTDKVFVKKKKNGKTVKIPLIGAPNKCTGKWVADSELHLRRRSTANAESTASCKK